MNGTDLAVIEQITNHPGIKGREIAKAVGVSGTRVSQIMGKPEIKEIVEQVQHGFVQANARRAAGNITQIIHSPRAEDKELRLKYSAEVARAMGILPSQAQSVFIQNIYNDNRTTELPPEIVALVARQRASIDVEYQIVDQADDGQGNE